MMPNAYVRESLAATRKGIPSGELLVDLWASELFDCLEEMEDEPSPTQAYDAIAKWARLERCVPEVMDKLGIGGRWQEARVRVKAKLVKWLPLALTVPVPEGWLAEAVTLAKACDEDASLEELAGWSEELLLDLDDADLVAWAAQQAGRPDPVLEVGLSRCAVWLADNCDRFFPASVFVQCVGQAMRPDLPGFDLQLSGTADKFVLLLDAMEDIEDLMGESPSLVVLTHPSWVGFPELPLAMSAAALPVTATVKNPSLFRREWRSPDGTGFANLVIAPPEGVSSPVRLTIEGVTGQVVLAGLSADIVEEAADFDFGALKQARDAGQPLSLIVNGIEWLPTKE